MRLEGPGTCDASSCPPPDVVFGDGCEAVAGGATDGVASRAGCEVFTHLEWYSK